MRRKHNRYVGRVFRLQFPNGVNVMRFKITAFDKSAGTLTTRNMRTGATGPITLRAFEDGVRGKIISFERTR